jgi:fructokinase
MTIHKVCCIGEVVIDRISCEPGIPFSKVKSWKDHIGGAPLNVACALSKLGINSKLISCLDESDNSKNSLKLLKNSLVDISDIVVDPITSIRIVQVEISSDNERSFVGFEKGNSDFYSDECIDKSHLDENLYLNTSHFVIGTLIFGSKSSEFAAKIIEVAVSKGISIVVDANLRNAFWKDQELHVATARKICNYANILKLAKEEALKLFYTTDPLKIKEVLPNCWALVVTDGPNEVKYSIGNINGVLDSFKVKVVDSTGAGDAFLAGFIHQILHVGKEKVSTDKYICENVLRFACASGAIVASGTGAVDPQPSFGDINKFLIKYKY